MERLSCGSDIVGRFRGNWRGFMREYRVLLVLTVAAALADGASTVCFMMRDGIEAEGHPVIRMVSVVLGPVAGPVLGKAAQLAFAIGLAVFLRRQAVYIFVAMIVLYGWAAWYNIWGCS